MSQVDSTCERNIRELRTMWEEIFDTEICVNHLSKLVGHVEAFFSEIIEETQKRRNTILEQINCEYQILSVDCEISKMLIPFLFFFSPSTRKEGA